MQQHAKSKPVTLESKSGKDLGSAATTVLLLYGMTVAVQYAKRLQTKRCLTLDMHKEEYLKSVWRCRKPLWYSYTLKQHKNLLLVKFQTLLDCCLLDQSHCSVNFSSRRMPASR